MLYSNLQVEVPNLVQDPKVLIATIDMEVTRTIDDHIRGDFLEDLTVVVPHFRSIHMIVARNGSMSRLT